MAKTNYRSSYEPTELEKLVGLLKKNGVAERRAVGKTVSVRVDHIGLATIDALATMADKSRNSMMLHLLEVGFEEIFRAFDDDLSERFSALQKDMLKRFMADTKGDVQIVEEREEVLHGNAHA